MSSYFTSYFLELFFLKLVDKLISSEGSYPAIYSALKEGDVKAVTNGEKLISFLEELETENPELRDVVISLIDSGKLNAVRTENEIHEYLESIVLQKSILRELSNAFHNQSEVVYHNGFKNNKNKEKISFAGNIPVFDEKDLSGENLKYLFKESSLPLNIGEKFNWSHMLVDYVMPFKKIRILDPYLFLNVKSVKLKSMIRTLARKSSKDIQIEIISNIYPRNGPQTSKDILSTLNEELYEIDTEFKNLKTYTQKSSASKLFHKRVIWTDFWTITTDRGFDFVDIKSNQEKVKQENTLFLTGRYSSVNSIWHQVNNNWKDYISNTKPIEELKFL